MCRRVIPIAHADLERAIETVRAEAAATGHPGGCVALPRSWESRSPDPRLRQRDATGATATRPRNDNVTSMTMP